MTEKSPLAGSALRDAAITEQFGALLLAVREVDGTFVTRPSAGTVIAPEQVLMR